MYVYNAAWFALAIVLTSVIGAGAVYAWRTRGFRPTLFLAGMALLPMAMYLTGTLRLVGVIADQLTSYFVGFAFSPKVWLGVIVGGVGVVLMATAVALKRRGIGSTRKESQPKIPQRRPGEAKAALPPQTADPELDDIEAILRKHGIQ